MPHSKEFSFKAANWLDEVADSMFVSNIPGHCVETSLSWDVQFCIWEKSGKDQFIQYEYANTYAERRYPKKERLAQNFSKSMNFSARIGISKCKHSLKLFFGDIL